MCCDLQNNKLYELTYSSWAVSRHIRTGLEELDDVQVPIAALPHSSF